MVQAIHLSSDSLERKNAASRWEANRIFDRGRNIIDCGEPKLEPNEHLRRIMIAASDSGGEDTEKHSTTELDSHANMVVMGKHCEILEDTGEVVDVKPFTPDYKPTAGAKIVDAAVRYVSEYDGKEYVLVFRNCIHFPSMDHNLVPPFIMREKGIQVNDVPKIHLDDPSIDDHSIYLRQHDVRIPLKLRGIFSYFNTSKPSDALLEGTEDMYDMTPINWNPHNTVYAENEDAMLDWEGNMKEPKHRERIYCLKLKMIAQWYKVCVFLRLKVHISTH